MQIGNARYPCVLYKPVSFENGFLLSACADFIDNINVSVRDSVEKLIIRIKSGEYVVSNPTGYFACDFSKFVNVLLSATDLKAAEELAQKPTLVSMQAHEILRIIPKNQNHCGSIFPDQKNGRSTVGSVFLS